MHLPAGFISRPTIANSRWNRHDLCIVSPEQDGCGAIGDCALVRRVIYSSLASRIRLEPNVAGVAAVKFNFQNSLTDIHPYINYHTLTGY